MEKTLRFVYNSPRLSFWLKLLSFIISLLTVAAFTYMFFALWQKYLKKPTNTGHMYPETMTA